MHSLRERGTTTELGDTGREFMTFALSQAVRQELPSIYNSIKLLTEFKTRLKSALIPKAIHTQIITMVHNNWTHDKLTDSGQRRENPE